MAGAEGETYGAVGRQIRFSGMLCGKVCACLCVCVCASVHAGLHLGLEQAQPEDGRAAGQFPEGPRVGEEKIYTDLRLGGSGGGGREVL